MTHPHRQSRLKWTRWAAQAVLILIIAYPFGGGPAYYGVGGGWISYTSWKRVYGPCESVAKAVFLQEAYDAYKLWWGKLGHSHATNSE